MKILEMENDGGEPIVEVENLKRYLRNSFLSSSVIGFALTFMSLVMLFR